MTNVSTNQPRLKIVRTFKAPRTLVWRAWTDPKHVAQWWGPRGFTTTVNELDPRPGGAINFDMHGFGDTYPMTGKFLEVVEPERLTFISYALNAAREPMLEVRSELTLAEEGGKTTLTLELFVIKVTPEGEFALEGMEEGWNQTLDRLQEHLAT
jgi:uncharacterized protein YndB with AHSA1/START domain